VRDTTYAELLKRREAAGMPRSWASTFFRTEGRGRKKAVAGEPARDDDEDDEGTGES
jgi:hypothetical protein